MSSPEANQAAFEAWYSGRHEGFMPGMFEGEYDWADAQPCWISWQESRKAALEDAAKAIASVCSEQATDWGDGYNQGAILCEIKVRNLL